MGAEGKGMTATRQVPTGIVPNHHRTDMHILLLKCIPVDYITVRAKGKPGEKLTARKSEA